MKGGQYAKFAFGYWYYPCGFVDTGFFYWLHCRPITLDFTRHRTYLVDYLAVAASEIQALAPYLNITRLK